MTEQNKRNDGVSTYKCEIEPTLHFKVWTISNGYVYERCSTCGKIFQMEKSPELTQKDERIRELIEQLQWTTQEMDDLEAHVKVLVEALTKILAMTDQYEDCRDIGKVADTALAFSPKSS